MTSVRDLAPGDPFPDLTLPDVAAALRAGLDARWPFLSDAERTVLPRWV